MGRIRILEAVAGDDFSWSPGDLVDLPDEVAAGWADGHRAVWADPDAGDAGSEPAPELPPVVQTPHGVVLPVISAVLDLVGLDSYVLPTRGGATPRRWVVTVDVPDDQAAALVLDPATEQPGDPENEQAPATEPPTSEPGAPAKEGDVFDPSAHVAADVLAYLADVGEAEAMRVLDAEAAGQDRRGIAGKRQELLAKARANDAEQTAGQSDTVPENTADLSRGGGRADVPETR